MWRGFSSWVANLPWRPAVIAVVSFLLAWGATRLLDWGVEDKGTRDAGIVGVAILTIIGFYVALVFGPWVRGQRTAEANVTAVPVAPEAVVDRLQFQAWVKRWATGELTVGEVQPNLVATAIDYLPSRGYAFVHGESMKRLRLAEVALLRRLNVAEDQTQDSWRCETVLRAGGLSDPMSAIARLHDMKLITTNGSVVNLTDLGRQFVWLSSQCLTHYPILTAAYREIAKQINKTIRFDGQPLS